VKLPAFVMDSFTDPGDVVFEPFCGSGTSLLAAQRTGRRACAMEISAEYVDLAIARWRHNHPEEAVTLDGDGRSYDEIAKERANGTP